MSTENSPAQLRLKNGHEQLDTQKMIAERIGASVSEVQRLLRSGSLCAHSAAIVDRKAIMIFKSHDLNRHRARQIANLVAIAGRFEPDELIKHIGPMIGIPEVLELTATAK